MLHRYLILLTLLFLMPLPVNAREKHEMEFTAKKVMPEARTKLELSPGALLTVRKQEAPITILVKPVTVRQLLILAAIIILLLLYGISLMIARLKRYSTMYEQLPEHIPEITAPEISTAVIPSPPVFMNLDTQDTAAAEVSHHQEEKPKAAIFLFGNFTVLDKEGNDISKLFSPLVKELFLLLLMHSLMGKNGISSEKINEILWAGRSVKDARNNRSVNLVKLKNILDRTGNYTLMKENGKWILHFDEDSIHIDLKAYLQLLPQNGTTDQETVALLLRFAGRGELLSETEYEWLDKFKSDLTTDLIPLLINFLEDQSRMLCTAFIIDVCNCILHFDSLSEDAMIFKCRALIARRQHSTAKAVYNCFAKEYQTIYGEAFEKDYNEVANTEHIALHT